MSVVQYRLKSQVNHDLDGLKRRLQFLVKAGVVTSESAMSAYLDACRQISCNESALEVDTREWIGVRCRSCGRSNSVLAGTSRYSCKCSPATAREAFLDMVGPTGAYVLADTIAAKQTDKMADRAKALENGASLEEADELLQ